jgi:hypothetical protein
MRDRRIQQLTLAMETIRVWWCLQQRDWKVLRGAEAEALHFDRVRYFGVDPVHKCRRVDAVPLNVEGLPDAWIEATGVLHIEGAEAVVRAT